jgi:D-alanyl-D-alanine carboxypeptidase (penicillin-binding protein 5/6)
VEEFAKLMNERARQVGAKDTHFVNPHGLYHPDHYSSAYDLALITQEALKHTRFRELVGMKAAEVSRPDLASREQVTNHNKLLWRESYVDGVKTGWVRRSGPCVVASGTKDGWQLIAVVLDSPDRYEDALSLLEYGFSTFRLKVYAREGDAVGQARVRRGRSRTLPAVCTKTLASVLGPGMPPEGRLTVKLDELKAPVAKGAKVGRVELEVAGKVADSCALVAGEAVEVSKLTMALVWGLRVLGLVALAAVTVRTGAKIIKARRRRWHSFPP